MRISMSGGMLGVVIGYLETLLATLLWITRTSYTTMAYKALKTNLKVSEPLLPLTFFLFYAYSKGL